MAGQVRRPLTRNEMLVLLVPGSVGVVCIFLLAVLSLGLILTLMCTFTFTTVVCLLAAITQSLSGGRFPDKHLWLKAGASFALLVATMTVDYQVRDNPDVDAARACHLLANMTEGLATPDQVEVAARKLIGTKIFDDAAGRPPPKWSDLGGSIFGLADEFDNGDALDQLEESQVLAGCAAIPDPAKVRGGYVR